MFHTSVPHANDSPFYTFSPLCSWHVDPTDMFRAVKWLQSKINSCLHINSWTVLCRKLPIRDQTCIKWIELNQVWYQKYKCTCRIKPKTEIILHGFKHRGRIKICLTLCQKYIYYIQAFTGVSITFLIFALKHRLWVLVRTTSFFRYRLFVIMWFLFGGGGGFPLPLGAWDSLLYFIVALSWPSILLSQCLLGWF